MCTLKKRILAVLMAVCMVLASLPLSAFAAVCTIQDAGDPMVTAESISSVSFDYTSETETMTVKLSSDIKNSESDHYMVKVTNPYGYLDFFTQDTAGSQTISWDYINEDDTDIEGNPGARIGRYAFQLYHYTGGMLKDKAAEKKGQVTFKDGEPQNDGTHTYTKIGTPMELSVGDFNDFTVSASIATVGSGEPEAKGSIDLKVDHTAHTANISGNVADLKHPNTSLGIVLYFDSPGVKFSKDIKLICDTDDKGSKVWRADPATVRVVKQGTPYTVKLTGFNVADLNIAQQAGAATHDKYTGTNKDLKDADEKGLIDVSLTDNTLVKLASQAIAKDDPLRGQNRESDIKTLAAKTAQVLDKDSSVRYVAQPHLNYILKDYKPGISLTMDISAVYDLIITTNMASDVFTCPPADGKEPSGDSYVLKRRELAVNDLIGLSVTVPAGLVGQYSELAYVGHKGNHYHALKKNSGALSYTFTSSDSLGSFIFGVDVPVEAGIEDTGMYYKSLQEAVNSAENGQTILLVNQSRNTAATVSKECKLYMKSGAYDVMISENTLTAASNLDKKHQVDTEGTHVFTFTRKPGSSPSTPSTPSTPTGSPVPSTPTPTAAPSVSPTATPTPTPGAGEQGIEMTSSRQKAALLRRTTGDDDCNLKIAPKVAGESFTYTYSSSDPTVATVNNKGVIRYQGVGEATVHVNATSASTGKNYGLDVEVKVLKPGKPTFTPSNAVKIPKTFTVTTSTVRGADGFEVQYSLKNLASTTKGAKKADIEGGKKAVRKAVSTYKSGKSYYVRVRAYQIVDGSKVLGAWSPVKKITSR